MACISANQAITSGAEKIIAGQADIVVAGGCETFSDLPIRFSKPIRQRLLQLNKAMKKGIMGPIGLLKGLTLNDLAPEQPAIANYTTGEVCSKYLFTLIILNYIILYCYMFKNKGNGT